VNQPQNSLLGEGYIGIVAKPTPLVLASGAQPYLAGTRLRAGSLLPDLINGEVDSYVNDGVQPANVTILAASPVQCTEYHPIQTGNATLYTAPSGAMVFDSGTFVWYLGLDASWSGPGGNVKYKAYFHDWDRFTSNIFNAMIAASTR
jgi:hypothetical protein